jgi:hypothetical protein
VKRKRCSLPGEHRFVRWRFRSGTLEWSPFRQGIQRLREFVDTGLVGLRKAIHFAPACLTNRNPPSLRIDEIRPLSHGDERGQDTEQGRKVRLVLAERIALADRGFGGRRGLYTIEWREEAA